MSDLIDRQKAIDAVLDLSEKLSDEMLFIDAIVDEIENVPSADPERKKGEWISDGKQMIINLENAREQYKELGYPHRNILRLKCSECGILTLVDESIRYDYCPHCGAEME